MKLFDKCVYAILDEDRLLKADQGPWESDSISESEPWIAVEGWLREAEAQSEEVPIVFADAKHGSRSLGWAVLTDVAVGFSGDFQGETTYRFRALRPPLAQPRTDFRLLESDWSLTDTRNRLYARLLTPPFLRELADKDGPRLADWLKTPDAFEYVFSTGFDNESKRSEARLVLARVIGIAHRNNPENWGIILTPGRIRLMVGNERVVDVGNRLNTLIFPDLVCGAVDDDEGFSIYRYFEKYEPALVHRIESLRSEPRVGDVIEPAFVMEHFRLDSVLSIDDPSTTPLASVQRVYRSDALRAACEAQCAPFDPRDLQDGWSRVMRALVLRRGYSPFRSQLLEAYGRRCAISDWCVEDVLEAAHILPYRGEHTNHVTNGLLLRSDVHALFDLDLLEVDPENLTVIVNSRLADTPYAKFHGQKLRLPEDIAMRPSCEALRERRRLCAP